MADLSEECLDLLNSGDFRVVDPGPLHTPIYRFSIQRDEKQRLIVKTEVPPNATSRAIRRPSGIVSIATERVLLRDQGGLEATLMGVIPLKLVSNTDGINEKPHQESAQVHIAEVRNVGGNPATYAIDWLENLPLLGFVWPNHSNVEIDLGSNEGITLGAGIIIKRKNGRSRLSRNVAKLTVEGCAFYVCALHSDGHPRAIKPGCIVFDGTPDDAFRTKVRTALSLALGLYLVYLGTTNYDNNWRIVSALAQSAYSIERRAFEMRPELPAPLGTRFVNAVNPAELTRAISAFVRDFESLDLANLNWAYWHACVATPHIAPVHFGAAIEALQNAYIKSHPGEIEETLVPRSVWRQLRKNMAAAIDDEAGISAQAKGALKFKLKGLNAVDQRTRLKAMMAAIRLGLGRDEDAAWQRRNKAAHGTPVPEDQQLAAIRDAKLLKGLFCRLLLRITNAADQYIDYTSACFPYRDLAEAPPDMRSA